MNILKIFETTYKDTIFSVHVGNNSLTELLFGVTSREVVIKCSMFDPEWIPQLNDMDQSMNENEWAVYVLF